MESGFVSFEEMPLACASAPGLRIESEFLAFCPGILTIIEVTVAAAKQPMQDECVCGSK